MILVMSLGTRGNRGLLTEAWSTYKILSKQNLLIDELYLFIAWKKEKQTSETLRLKKFVKSFVPEHLGRRGLTPKKEDTELVEMFCSLLNNHTYILNETSKNVLFDRIKKKDGDYYIIFPFENFPISFFDKVALDKNIKGTLKYLRCNRSSEIRGEKFSKYLYSVKNYDFARFYRFNCFDKNVRYYFDKEEQASAEELISSLPFIERQDSTANLIIPKLFPKSPMLDKSVFNYLQARYPAINRILKRKDLRAKDKDQLVNVTIPDLIAFNFAQLYPSKNIGNASRDILGIISYMSKREKKNEKHKEKHEDALHSTAGELFMTYEALQSIIMDKFPQFKTIYGNIIFGILSDNLDDFEKVSQVEAYNSLRDEFRDIIMLPYKLEEYSSSGRFDIKIEEEIRRIEQNENRKVDREEETIYLLNERLKLYIQGFFERNYPALYKYLPSDSNEGLVEYSENLVIDLMVYFHMVMKQTPKPVDAIRDILIFLKFLNNVQLEVLGNEYNIKPSTISRRKSQKIGKLKAGENIFQAIIERLPPEKSKKYKTKQKQSK